MSLLQLDLLSYNLCNEWWSQYFHVAFWKLICVFPSLIHNICLCDIHSFVILLQWSITKNVFWLSRGLSSLHLRLASVLLPYNTQHSVHCTTWHKQIPHQCNTLHTICKPRPTYKYYVPFLQTRSYLTHHILYPRPTTQSRAGLN